MIGVALLLDAYRRQSPLMVASITGLLAVTRFSTIILVLVFTGWLAQRVRQKNMPVLKAMGYAGIIILPLALWSVYCAVHAGDPPHIPRRSVVLACPARGSTDLDGVLFFATSPLFSCVKARCNCNHSIGYHVVLQSLVATALVVVCCARAVGVSFSNYRHDVGNAVPTAATAAIHMAGTRLA